jgi:serine/threonine-protein kinase
MSTLVGKEIHGYQITKVIGKGGMGEVYHATHLKTNRPVAIKLLIHERGIDRFRNEARLQANVNHPNIARLYDLIEIQHRPALIIEYIDGLDLDIYLE